MRALLALFVVVSACTPELADRHFACEDGQCPPRFSCHADGLCHSPDSLGTELYSLCADDSECASGVCANAPSMIEASPGLCTQSCANDDDCPDANGRSGICAFGSCFGTCTGASDCDGDAKCVVAPGHDPDTICVLFEDPIFEGTRGCTSDSMCVPPTRCRQTAPGAAGMCSWPCSPSAECPGQSECRDWPGTMPPDFICLARCTSPADCTQGAVCTATGMPNVSFCAASGWSLP